MKKKHILILIALICLSLARGVSAQISNVKKAAENEAINPTNQSIVVEKPVELNQDQPSLQSYSKYDFIPGGKIIFFDDFSQDAVKPVSYGTLKSIADVLKENPEVRVKIVGYTDSDGADAANLDLSKHRGASVQAELVKTFGIDASRLESDGLGESKPVAPNDTQVNKALNRRVEFIKL